MLTVAVADGFRKLTDREASDWPVVGLLVTYGVAVDPGTVPQFTVVNDTQSRNFGRISIMPIEV